MFHFKLIFFVCPVIAVLISGVTHGNPIVPQRNPIVPQGNPIVLQGTTIVPQGTPIVPQGNPIVSSDPQRVGTSFWERSIQNLFRLKRSAVDPMRKVSEELRVRTTDLAATYVRMI